MLERRRLAAAAAALSLCASLFGITWGLPARWHPDEKADDAAALLQERSWIPRSFINPSLPLYLTIPVLAAQDALSGRVLSGAAADPLLAARVLSALAGALGVLALGLWAGGPEAPTAAFLLALCPGYVNLCHFATPEPWLLLLTIATLVGCRRHLDGTLSAGALGVIAGLAGSTKYTAAALLAPVLLAVWLGPEAARARPRPGLAAAVGALAAAIGVWIAVALPLADRLHLPDARLLEADSARRFVGGLGRLLALAGVGLGGTALAAARESRWARPIVSAPTARALLGSTAGFLLGTPGALARPVAFLSDLAFNQQTRFEYKGLVGEATSFTAYVSLLADALTGPVLLLAVIGLAAAAVRGWRGQRLAWVWLAGAVAPYLLVASSGHRALRFAAPIFPAAALLAAGALALLAPRARTVAVAAIALRLAVGTVLVDRLFLVDSRRLAARWIVANVPATAPVDVITNHPGYAPSPEGRVLRVVPTLSREMAPAERFQEAAGRYPDEAAPWLVLTGAYYQRFLEHEGQQPERARFFRDLLDGRLGFDVVARFRQEGWRHPPVELVDPEIVVLRRRSAG
jgi:hypothetical protein